MQSFKLSLMAAAKERSSANLRRRGEHRLNPASPILAKHSSSLLGKMVILVCDPASHKQDFPHANGPNPKRQTSAAIDR
jgi:hypothetical protein